MFVLTLLSVFGLIFIVLLLAIAFFIVVLVMYMHERSKVFANCKQTGSFIENMFEKQRAVGYQLIKYCASYLSKAPLKSGKRLPKKLRSTLAEEMEKSYQFALTEGRTANAALLTALEKTQFVIDNFDEIQTTKALESAVNIGKLYRLGRIF